MIKITLKQGLIGAMAYQRRTVAALGLRYREHSRVVKNTPQVRGMIKSVAHLVSLEKDIAPQTPRFAGVVSYELGPVPEKKVSEKKVKKSAPAVSDAASATEKVSVASQNVSKEKKAKAKHLPKPGPAHKTSKKSGKAKAKKAK